MYARDRILLYSSIVFAVCLPFYLVNTYSIDFIQYYSGFNLLLNSSNPYDSISLLTEQRNVGSLASEPMMLWVPPWTMVLMSPFLSLPTFQLSLLLWRMACVCILIITYHLFVTDQSNKKIKVFSILLLITNFPFFTSMQVGQVSPLLLLGVLGIMWGVLNTKPVVTGLSLPLLFIKPHLFIIFLSVFLFQIFKRKEFKYLAFGSFSFLFLLLITWFVNSSVIQNWINVMTGRVSTSVATNTSEWLCGTLVCNIKPLIDYIPFGKYLVVLIPLALTTFFLRNTSMFFSLVISLSISLVFSPYGWCFDSVVLLPINLIVINDYNLLIRHRVNLFYFFIILNFYGFLSLAKHNPTHYHFWWYPVGTLLIVALYVHYRKRTFPVLK